jgi:hypothetical protein
MASKQPAKDPGKQTEESVLERVERIFQTLPRLGTAEYLEHLKTASGAELPAEMLVRAFRELLSVPGEEPGKLSRAAEATLERLVVSEQKYGYLRALRQKARAMVARNDWIDVEYLVDEAKGEIGLALAGPRGVGADRHWIAFQLQRLADAWRNLEGRRGNREPERVAPALDQETGEEIDPTDEFAGDIALHGNVSPDKEAWLESYVRRTWATIKEDRIREVALDMLKRDRTPASKLAKRYNVDRQTITDWRHVARAKLLTALRKQDEVDIDTSWLKAR